MKRRSETPEGLRLFEKALAEARQTCASAAGDAPRIHGHMIYRCRKCGRSWAMGLEYGVEDWGAHGRPHQPTPFIIACKCGGPAQDVSGVIPSCVERPVQPGERYFAYDKSGNKYAHGIASVYWPEAR